LNPTEVNSDDPDDDGVSEPLSAQQVVDMVSEFKTKVDAETTQVGKVKIQVGQETVQDGVEVSQDGANALQDAVKDSHVPQDGLEASHVPQDGLDTKHIDPVAKQDDAKTSQDGVNASQDGPEVSQVGKVANQDDSDASQVAVKDSHTSQDGVKASHTSQDGFEGSQDGKSVIQDNGKAFQDGSDDSQVGKTAPQVNPVSPQVGASSKDEQGIYSFDIREFQKLCEVDGNVEHIDKLYEVNSCFINVDEAAMKAYTDWYYRGKAGTSQDGKVNQVDQVDLGVPINDLGSSKEDHEGSKGDLGNSKVETPSSQKEQGSMPPLLVSFLAMCNNVETPISLINNFMQDKDRSDLVFGSTVAMAAFTEKLKQGK
jgi:hypothetical protein